MVYVYGQSFHTLLQADSPQSWIQIDTCINVCQLYQWICFEFTYQFEIWISTNRQLIYDMLTGVPAEYFWPPVALDINYKHYIYIYILFTYPMEYFFLFGLIYVDISILINYCTVNPRYCQKHVKLIMFITALSWLCQELSVVTKYSTTVNYMPYL